MKKITSIVGRGKFLILSLLTGLALFIGSQTGIAEGDAASIKAFQKIMDDPKVTTKINMTNTKGKKYYVAFAAYPIGTPLVGAETDRSFSGHAFVCFATTDSDGKITDLETHGFEVDDTKREWKQTKDTVAKLLLMLKGVQGKVKPISARIDKTTNMLVTEVDETQFNVAKKVLPEWNGKKNYVLGKSDCAALAIDVAKRLKENKVKIEIPEREKYMRKLEEDFGNMDDIILSCKVSADGNKVEELKCELSAVWDMLDKTGYTHLPTKDQESLDRMFAFAMSGPGVPPNWEFREKMKNKKLSEKQEEELMRKIVSYPNTYMEYFRKVNTK